MIQTLEWTDSGVRFIDQTKLPTEETYVTCRTYTQVADVIRNMVVRGAPAIGVAAAMGIALGVKTSKAENGGDLKPADREYVSKVVAARTGLSQADADRRVNDVVTLAKADMDAARKATAQLAFWLTASLLIGAFCASLAATEGGGLRDGTWRRRSTR